MSGTNFQECSYLKVDHDFEYRTNDGRQIAIKKDEKLYLIQKTNDDWWKVIRNQEQRSFYVPVTYVSELGRGILPDRNLAYKQHETKLQNETLLQTETQLQNDAQIAEDTAKDYSARRKHVEKWLSNTFCVAQGAAGGSEIFEDSARLERAEGPRIKEFKKRIEQQKENCQGIEENDSSCSYESKHEKKSLDRFRNVVKKLSSSIHASEDAQLCSISTRISQESNRSRMAVEHIVEKSSPDLNCTEYSPKKKTPLQHLISHNQKLAMMASNSTEFLQSNNDCTSANSDNSSIKNTNKSTFAKELNLSVQKNNAIKRYSNSSTERHLVKPNVQKRTSSPVSGNVKTSTSLDSTSPQSSTIDYSENTMKILSDKRKSWAIEELMTELTQIRKERIDDNVSNFVLRSVEIKDRFDPLEKLTQELHELHASQRERLNSKSKDDVSPRRQSGDPLPTWIKETVGAPLSGIRILPHLQHEQLPRGSEYILDKPKLPKTRTLLANNEVFSNQPNPMSCKSTKRQDEYEEANILNDESRILIDGRDEISDRMAFLSADKEHYASAYQEHSQLFQSDSDNFDNFEKPSYSNISIKPENEARVRPQLKLKIKSVDTKIKLTPSLEKLASEIQFLPANRTSVVDNDKQQSPLTKNNPLCGLDQNEIVSKQKNHSATLKDSFDDGQGLINVLQDREMWKNFKSKVSYRGSFKSTEEQKSQAVTKDVSNEGDHPETVVKPGKSKLQKSATFNCVAVPEYYKHFQRHRDAICNSRGMSVRKAKRRSRSLEDMKFLVNLELKSTLAASKRLEAATVSPGSIKTAVKPIPKSRNIVSVKYSKGQNQKYTKGCLQVSAVSISKSDETLSNDFTNLRVFDANKSTAVSFKNLLCTSDSGSEEYLHYKAFPKSTVGRIEQSTFTSHGKTNNKAIVSSESLPVINSSVSDEQMLSSNISSEAFFSQSESEAYALSELSNNSSPVTIDHDKANFVNLPPGWSQEFDAQSKQICFLNTRGEKWFSSNDEEGKIYFFEENSNESSWVLPTVSVIEPTKCNIQANHGDIELRSSSGSEKFRIGKARSLVVGNHRSSKIDHVSRRSGSVSHDWPQLFNGNMCILKEGTLQRTKITENGKRLRKNWNSSYVVLSELFLLFFKDAKAFLAMKSEQLTAAKPDICVDLNGATVEPGDKASSRKNVYIIGNILGLQVLIQSDNTAVANEWYKEIYNVIYNLPSGFDVQTMLPPSSERPHDAKNKQFLYVNSTEDNKTLSKINRSRSIKIKKIDGSTEDLSGSSAERQTKIKAKLKRFFQRRPTMDALVKNGIYKDEPAFGSYLKDVCSRQPPMVPRFVKACIELLESNQENMKTDGLYRASGNLSQIQKIRLQIDQNNFNILAQEEDVHVLTGALKLFFRELKEPLIPYEFFEKALKGSMSKKKSERIQVFREIVRALSPAHYDTLRFLLRHLLRVTSYQEHNRMHIPNLAIVFGPTLMWPAVESVNMALDLMQQNLVIECLLSEYDEIFK